MVDYITDEKKPNEISVIPDIPINYYQNLNLFFLLRITNFYINLNIFGVIKTLVVFKSEDHPVTTPQWEVLRCRGGHDQRRSLVSGRSSLDWKISWDFFHGFYGLNISVYHGNFNYEWGFTRCEIKVFVLEIFFFRGEMVIFQSNLSHWIQERPTARGSPNFFRGRLCPKLRFGGH